MRPHRIVGKPHLYLLRGEWRVRIAMTGGNHPTCRTRHHENLAGSLLNAIRIADIWSAYIRKSRRDFQ